jgi:hypothetical protein
VKREDIDKLIGGYAAGILSAEEQRALFEAALQDQALFDELMREEGLRELLAGADARRELRAALEPAPAGSRIWRWWPAPVVAMAATVFVAVVVLQRQVPSPPVPVAQLRVETPPQAPPLPPPEPAARPVQRRRAQAAPAKESRAEKAAVEPPPPPVTPDAATEAQPREPRNMARSLRMDVRTSIPMAFRARSPEGPARELYYAPSQAPLGLRYSLEADVLEVEANSAARLRVLENGVMLFDRDIDARVRYRIAVQAAGSSLRVSVEKGEAAQAAASALQQVNTSVERATYAVAPPGVNSLSIIVR